MNLRMPAPQFASFIIRLRRRPYKGRPARSLGARFSTPTCRKQVEMASGLATLGAERKGTHESLSLLTTQRPHQRVFGRC